MPNNLPKYVCVLCFSIVITLSTPSLQAADIHQLQTLIKQKKYPEAYQIASALAATLDGQADFDFLYAMAAIEAGHPDYAIFALERLSYDFPDNGRIKIELARAYFLAGDNKNAKALFQQVLNTSPPANVVQNIHIFLTLIERQDLARKSRLSAAITLTTGWDSNFNSAPDLNVIQIGKLSFNLNENSRQQSTYYTGLDANLNYHQAMNKNFYLDYGAYYQQRNNHGNNLDTITTGIVIAPTILKDNHRYRIPLQYQQLELDKTSYSRYGSLGIEWTPRGKPNSQWTHFLQYGKLNYINQPNRDMTLVILGSAYQYITPKSNLYQAAVFYNDQSSKLDTGKANETDTFGLRSYMKWPLSTKHSIYSKFLLETMKYGATNPVFGVTRKDNLLSAAIGWEINLNNVTVLAAETEYLTNSSNIDLYKYDRKSAFISLRYNFL